MSILSVMEVVITITWKPQKKKVIKAMPWMSQVRKRKQKTLIHIKV